MSTVSPRLAWFPWLAALAALLASGCAKPEKAAGEGGAGQATAPQREARAQPQPAPTLRGEYFYMADAATFTDCSTGQRMPVAMERDSVALERAYLAAGGAERGPMLASIEGRVEQRPPMEGEGLRPTVIVDRFVALAPRESCPPRDAQ